MKLLLIPYLAAHLAVGAPATADIHYMPPGAKVTLPDGTEGRGFNLGEYTLLLQLDGELWDANQKLDLYADVGKQYKVVLDQKDDIIESLKEDKEILRGRSLRLETKWQESEDARVAAEGGSVVPWVIAAIGAAVGVAGACLFLGMVAAKDNS